MAAAIERIYSNRWENRRLISRGEFGEEVHEVLTDKKVTCAAKTIRLPVQLGDKRNAGKINGAIEALRHLCELRHENIIHFYDIVVKEQDSTVVVLMELLTGTTLYDFINGVALPEQKVRTLSAQICSALHYLHSRQPSTIHRQISPKAIIINSDGDRAKLTDFGTAIQLIEAEPHHISTNLRGDMHFMAPELFLTEETQDTLYCCASDVWAFGCTVYQMATGTRPHSNCNNMLSIGRTIHNLGAPQLPDECSNGLKDFYGKCTTKEKKARESAADLLKHPFLSNESEGHQPSTDEQLTETYKATSPQGFCLVINVEKYGDSTPFSDRPEAQKETERIKSLFERLNFQVVLPTGTKSQDIWNTLQSTISSNELSNHGCFVCFLMARGTSGMIYSSDGEEMETRDILARFRASCSRLKGKPKLCFIQTTKSTGGESSEFDQFEETSFRFRESDFLLCSGTDDKKTPFVQTVCDVIESEQFREDHIEGMLAEVNKRLSIPPLQRGVRLCSTISETVSNLSKKYYLNRQTEDSLHECPNEWTDEQLTEQCRSATDAKQAFGPMDQTLLTIAANKGRGDLVRQMLQRGLQESISSQDVLGRTALCWAAFRGHESVLEEFGKAFENDAETLKKEVNIGDNLKQTPLILAAKKHQTNVLEQLSKMGADLNIQDMMKFPAITYAAKLGFVDTVTKLLSLGANPELVDFSGNTPLIWAARCGHSGVIGALREHLTDVEHYKKKGERDMNAQEWAKLCEHIECAVLIQDIIQTLSGQTTPPIAPLGEGSGGDGDPGGSSSNANDGTEPDGGDSNQGQSASGGARGDVSTNEASSLPYSMKRVNRGVAIIINILDFPRNPHLQRRDGSMEELREHGLYECFSRLGFDCKQYVNVGSRFFYHLLTVDCTEEDYSNSDALLLCIMSHGEQGYVFAHDGVRVLLERVFSQFRKCEALRNKPKIFIVQACRAIDEDRFVGQQIGQMNSGVHEDCLYIYSVVKGHVCCQDIRTRGSFTKALREVILTYFDQVNDEFVSMLCHVIRLVAEKSGGMQIACYRSTMLWPLRLPPLGLALVEVPD